jgi:hypothetical protein
MPRTRGGNPEICAGALNAIKYVPHTRGDSAGRKRGSAL